MPKRPLSQEAIKEAAECLRILSHSVRLEIVQLLSDGARTVGELAKECAVPHNVASTHLKLLQRCGFLANTRHGKTVRYRIIEKHLYDLLRCIEKRFG